MDIGTKFGRLEVVGVPYHRNTKGRKRSLAVKVRCTCGKFTDVWVYNLKSGNTKSCGCIQREGVTARMTTHGATSGQTRPRLYRIWRGMRSRCESPSASNYKWYGGKGVSVCAAWLSFVEFKDWAEANGYAPGLELDRKDTELGYFPGNCQWITKKANLRRRDLCWSDELDSRLVDYAGTLGVSPYEVIRLAVERYLESGETSVSDLRR